jgi:hypothetical protein
MIDGEKGPEGPELSPWFVTGLAEAAGSFTFGRSGRNLNLYFALKRPAADRPLLEAVQRFFGGAGTIYPVRSAAAGRRTTAWYFRVNRRDQLPRILDHFDRHPLRGSRAEVYLVWRRMVAARSDRFRRPDRAELASLAAELSRLTRSAPADAR